MLAATLTYVLTNVKTYVYVLYMRTAQELDAVATIMSKLQADLTAALLRLQRAGYSVRKGDRPGVTFVGGKPLTVTQIFDLVSNLK